MKNSHIVALLTSSVYLTRKIRGQPFVGEVIRKGERESDQLNLDRAASAFRADNLTAFSQEGRRQVGPFDAAEQIGSQSLDMSSGLGDINTIGMSVIEKDGNNIYVFTKEGNGETMSGIYHRDLVIDRTVHAHAEERGHAIKDVRFELATEIYNTHPFIILKQTTAMEFESNRYKKREEFILAFQNISPDGGITMNLQGMDKGIYTFVCRDHPDMGGTTITII